MIRVMNREMLLVDGLQYVNWNRDLFRKGPAQWFKRHSCNHRILGKYPRDIGEYR